jgi:hypothetical protein
MTATPRLAPELTPKTDGPARGFLNNVCIINPPAPRAAPASRAVTACGNLAFITIFVQARLSEPNPKIILKNSLTGIRTEPRAMLRIKKTTPRKTIIPIFNHRYLLSFDMVWAGVMAEDGNKRIDAVAIFQDVKS